MAAAAKGTAAAPIVQFFNVEPTVKIAYQLYAPPTADGYGAVPLVMVTGWSGVKEDWMDVPIALSRDRFVLVFDNRGMGGSTVPNEAFTIDRMALDAVMLSRYVFPTVDKCHVMGISMGGMIAQTIALNHSEFVNRLILGCTWSGGANRVIPADPGFFHASQTLAKLRTQQKSSPEKPIKIDPHSPQLRAAMKAVLTYNYTNGWINANPLKWEAVIDRSFAYVRTAKGLAMQFAALSQFDVSESVASIPHDTLIIHGTRDQMIPYENGPIIASKIKRSKLLELKDIGHVFWSTDDGRSVAAVKQFLSKPSAAASVTAVSSAASHSLRSRL